MTEAPKISFKDGYRFCGNCTEAVFYETNNITEVRCYAEYDKKGDWKGITPLVCKVGKKNYQVLKRYEDSTFHLPNECIYALELTVMAKAANNE